MNKLLAVVTLAIMVQSDLARSQGIYESVDKTDVMDCVMDFVENRQKFAGFGCLMEQEHSSGRASGLYSTFRTTIVFENSKDKLHRSDTIHSRSGEDPVKGVSIVSSVQNSIVNSEWGGSGKPMQKSLTIAMIPVDFRFDFGCRANTLLARRIGKTVQIRCGPAAVTEYKIHPDGTAFDCRGKPWIEVNSGARRPACLSRLIL